MIGQCRTTGGLLDSCSHFAVFQMKAYHQDILDALWCNRPDVSSKAMIGLCRSLADFVLSHRLREPWLLTDELQC